MSYNVRVTFAVRIADGIATGIWASSVLSTYINLLGGGTDEANEKVGYAQAIQGTFLAAAAIPAGWLAIKHRRDSILKVMGLLAFAAIATTSAALVLDVPYKYSLLCCGLALWGVAQANAPVLDALFADSVPTGNRSKLYTWLHMSYIVSQGIGPAVGALMFGLNGNVWKLQVLEHVMLVGMALACIPALLLMCFDDDKALGAESEGLLRVGLMQGSDAAHLDDTDEEAGAPWGGGGGVPVATPVATPGGSPGGDPSDYRQPFLDGWSSDVERDFRNQVSPLASPARPVPPAQAAAVTAANGIVYGTSNGEDGNMPPAETTGDTPSPALAVKIGAGTLRSCTAAHGPAADVSSHALLLTPTSMSPCSTATGRSGFASPADASPPPARRGGVGATSGARGSGAGVGGTLGSGSGGVTVAAATSAATTEARAGEGAPNPLATAAAIVERFQAVWRDVDSAAARETEAGAQGEPSGAGTAKAADSPPSFAHCRAVSIVGGVVPAVAAATADSSAGGRGGSGGPGGGGREGSEGGDDASRTNSVSAESTPSELSFSSLLVQGGSFKSTLTRPFSRTGSSSSNASSRERSGSAGGAGGGGGPVALTLSPYPEEDPTAEMDVSDGPSTPTLEPQADNRETVRQPVAAAARGKGLKAEPQAGRADLGLLPAPLAAASRALRTSGSGGGDGGSGGGDGGSGGGINSRLLPEGAAAAPAPHFPAGSGISVQPSATAPGPPFQPPPRLVPQRTELGLRDHRFLCLTMAWIPGLLAFTDCIMGLASGMTIKFFPIFFKDEVELPPMNVSLMYCAIPLCLSLAAFLAQRQSLLLGRVPTMVMNRGIGICILYWIATHTERWHEPRLMVPIYVLRTSIMNSIYPLQKSILMDFVPKERRASWNSLESVTSFGWSGSAALGGWLIHRYGFRVTFLVTAAMQSMGWAMSTLLLPIVPRKEKGLQDACRKAAAAGR